MHKIILIVAAGILLSGCSALKKSAVGSDNDLNISGKGLMSTIIANNLSERNFYISKAQISARTGGISAKFLASIKFRKPDSVLLVLRSIIGTEVARVFMTKDTILINDRINKDLIVGKPGIRSLKYGISPDMLFILLGDFITGNGFYDNNISCVNGIIKTKTDFKGKTIDYVIDCKKRKITEARIEEDIFSNEININIKKLISLSGFTVPFKIEITEVEADSGLSIQIDKIETDWKGKIEFLPGRNYAIRRLR